MTKEEHNLLDFTLKGKMHHTQEAPRGDDIHRSRSLSELPGNLRVPILKRKDTERTQARLEAGAAGVAELRTLREKQQQLIDETMVASQHKKRHRKHPQHHQRKPQEERQFPQQQQQQQQYTGFGQSPISLANKHLGFLVQSRSLSSLSVPDSTSIPLSVYDQETINSRSRALNIDDRSHKSASNLQVHGRNDVDSQKYLQPQKHQRYEHDEMQRRGKYFHENQIHHPRHQQQENYSRCRDQRMDESYSGHENKQGSKTSALDSSEGRGGIKHRQGMGDLHNSNTSSGHFNSSDPKSTYFEDQRRCRSRSYVENLALKVENGQFYHEHVLPDSRRKQHSDQQFTRGRSQSVHESFHYPAHSVPQECPGNAYDTSNAQTKQRRNEFTNKWLQHAQSENNFNQRRQRASSLHSSFSRERQLQHEDAQTAPHGRSVRERSISWNNLLISMGIQSTQHNDVDVESENVDGDISDSKVTDNPSHNKDAIEEDDHANATLSDDIPFVVKKKARSQSFTGDSLLYPHRLSIAANSNVSDKSMLNEAKQSDRSPASGSTKIIRRPSFQSEVVLTKAFGPRKITNPLQDVDINSLRSPGPLRAVTMQFAQAREINQGGAMSSHKNITSDEKSISKAQTVKVDILPSRYSKPTRENMKTINEDEKQSGQIRSTIPVASPKTCEPVLALREDVHQRPESGDFSEQFVNVFNKPKGSNLKEENEQVNLKQNGSSAKESLSEHKPNGSNANIEYQGFHENEHQTEIINAHSHIESQNTLSSDSCDICPLPMHASTTSVISDDGYGTSDATAAVSPQSSLLSHSYMSSDMSSMSSGSISNVSSLGDPTCYTAKCAFSSTTFEPMAEGTEDDDEHAIVPFTSEELKKVPSETFANASHPYNTNSKSMKLMEITDGPRCTLQDQQPTVLSVDETSSKVKALKDEQEEAKSDNSERSHKNTEDVAVLEEGSILVMSDTTFCPSVEGSSSKPDEETARLKQPFKETAL